MNKQLERMLDRAEGRWFSDIEAENLLGYADGLVARLEIHRAVANAEETILNDAHATILKRFAKAMQTQHGEQAAPKAKRDLGLVLRYAALAMVMRDPDFMMNKLACWLRTVLFALSDRTRVTESVRALHDACRRNLTSEDAAELLPYIKLVVDEFERVAGDENARKAA